MAWRVPACTVAGKSATDDHISLSHHLPQEPGQLLDSTGPLPTISRIVSSTTRRLGSRTAAVVAGQVRHLQMYRVEVSTSPLVDIVNANIQYLRQDHLEASELPEKVIVPVPASVLDRQLPGMVEVFNLNQVRPRRRKATKRIGMIFIW